MARSSGSTTPPTRRSCGRARAASSAACRWTRDLAADLSRCGVTVASGLARGIDAAAHEGALDAAGATLAILGCGPDLCYPPEHAALLQRIVERGAVATELAPGTPPRAWHFPLRNRILGGIVSGVVVVQAEPKSGALVTARHALEENRQVMAVPGDVLDPRSAGPHRLLREGAALVDGAADVLEALGWLALGAPSRGERGAERARSGVRRGDAARDAAPTRREAARSRPAPQEGHAASLLRALEAPLPVETLRERLGWSAALLLCVLSELELAGLVARGPGGLVQRTGPRRTC